MDAKFHLAIVEQPSTTQSAVGRRQKAQGSKNKTKRHRYAPGTDFISLNDAEGVEAGSRGLSGAIPPDRSRR